MKRWKLDNSPFKHIVLGLSIRELLASWTGHPFDFEIWVRLGFYMQNLSNPYRLLPYVPGLSFAPYPTMGSISYPPLSAFIFAASYRLYVFLGAPSRFLYYLILKQPMIFADLGVAILLSKIILLSGNSEKARKALLVWLYLPFGIIISAVWGQLDPIALFLSLLSILYFLESKWLSSAVFMGLGIYLKTLPIVFLPVLLMQPQMSSKLRYALASLSIPILGTLVPTLALNWGFQGLYNNTSFQVAIPSEGVMSLLGRSLSIIVLPPTIRYLTGAIWIPTLFASYAYIYKNQLSLFQGLVMATLVFSISRPFLPEQWTLYPLALLLVQGRQEIGHFIGLAISATGFLITNNTLLVRFFTPITVNAFYWDAFVNNQSMYAVVRLTVLGLLALIYFIEAASVVVGRESMLNRLIIFVASRQLPCKHVSPTEVPLS